LVPDTEQSMVLEAQLWGTLLSRDCARCLVARAMLHAGNQNYAGTRDDLLASHRLANLMGETILLVDGLVSLAIHGIAFRAEQALLQAETLDVSQLVELRRDVVAIVKYPDFSRCVDVFDRWSFYECVCRAAATGEMIPEGLLEDQ